MSQHHETTIRSHEMSAVAAVRRPAPRLLRTWIAPVLAMAIVAFLITDALPALGMTIVAALGIVLTVVAIIVQLSSDRYTGVAMMFLRARRPRRS